MAHYFNVTFGTIFFVEEGTGREGGRGREEEGEREEIRWGGGRGREEGGEREGIRRGGGRGREDRGEREEIRWGGG